MPQDDFFLSDSGSDFELNAKPTSKQRDSEQHHGHFHKVKENTSRSQSEKKNDEHRSHDHDQIKHISKNGKYNQTSHPVKMGNIRNVRNHEKYDECEYENYKFSKNHSKNPSRKNMESNKKNIFHDVRGDNNDENLSWEEPESDSNSSSKVNNDAYADADDDPHAHTAVPIPTPADCDDDDDDPDATMFEKVKKLKSKKAHLERQKRLQARLRLSTTAAVVPSLLPQHYSDNEQKSKNCGENKTKKKDKNKPRSESTKKKVPYLGRYAALGHSVEASVVPALQLQDGSDKEDIGTTYKTRALVSTKKKKAFDPRFEEMCGHFNPELFRKAYSFIGEYRKNEIDQLSSQLKHAKGAEKRDALSRKIQKLKEIERLEENRNRRNEIVHKLKKQEREKVAQGKRPYYLKESDIRRAELESKYQELRKTGKLKKYIEKRRKKQARKDKRLLPN